MARARALNPVAEPLQNLGRYRLQKKLGTGAMGVVYEALDPKLNRPVAIKTILKSHLDEDVAREYSVRFREEAQAVARLNHPNIVQVYDFGEEGDVAFIVMELIRGKDLKQSFDATTRFAPRDFVRMMCELLSALDYAHQAGIVHRDIKPANMMMDGQGRVKLMDFGVARINDSERTHRTQLGTMVGTPSYMSPEQVQGLRVDHRSDLFSCGIVLYQFLTNQRPFTGGDWTLRKMIVHEDPPRPSQLNSALSPEYDKVVSRALAKAPEARYQSAAHFGAALQRVLEGKPAEDEGDGTVMMGAPSRALGPKPSPAAPTVPPPAAAAPTAASQEVEVEFWRSIKESDDPEDFELYLQQFPTGPYAKLAERKIAKLRRGSAAAGTGTGPLPTGTNTSTTAAEADARRLVDERKRAAEDQAARDAEERARQEAEARAKREAGERLRREAEEKARLEADRVRRENEEKAKRDAEALAKRHAEEKARREAEERARLEQERVRLEAEAKAKREAEAKAKREAEENARREAEARARLERDRLEAEAKAKAKREAEEKARREVEERARLEQERARLEAEAKAKREAEAKVKREAEAKAKREAEEKARREAEERARLEQERARQVAEAKREAEAKAKREAEDKARREAEERARLERARGSSANVPGRKPKRKRNAKPRKRPAVKPKPRRSATRKKRPAPSELRKSRRETPATTRSSARARRSRPRRCRTSRSCRRRARQPTACRSSLQASPPC
ncbi:MAG: hypothetical protein E6H77_03960 [Betaproteobacteria bacterium]|nr:MAG: hypothetical protein E6H77_03960 [Betaproteobacteria bacterium]